MSRQCCLSREGPPGDGQSSIWSDCVVLSSLVCGSSVALVWLPSPSDLAPPNRDLLLRLHVHLLMYYGSMLVSDKNSG